jgi:hypothetical protein
MPMDELQHAFYADLKSSLETLAMRYEIKETGTPLPLRGFPAAVVVLRIMSEPADNLDMWVHVLDDLMTNLAKQMLALAAEDE